MHCHGFYWAICLAAAEEAAAVVLVVEDLVVAGEVLEVSAAAAVEAVVPVAVGRKWHMCSHNTNRHENTRQFEGYFVRLGIVYNFN
jgi:predicted nicotinamide N-methyase